MGVDFPKSPGVYFFLDNKGSLLYIGRTKAFRYRIAEHFNMNDRANMDRVAHILFVELPYEIAKKIEVELILELKPQYNYQTYSAKDRYCWFCKGWHEKCNFNYDKIIEKLAYMVD